MFADMAGFTAATQQDEPGSLRLIQELQELVRPLLTVHRGREVKSTGDGFLAGFDSALRAVQCAIAIQQQLHERNSQSGISPIPLRIGIHLGDVEQRGTDIFGDAVNIASRVEPLAPPGGVSVSGPVFDQVQNKVSNRFDRLGPQALKNVRSPVEIYQLVLPWTTPETPSASPGQHRLAVLPFSSISPDSKDEYFAEGLTEELITVISQIGGLQVIARTSVMPYKSTPKSVSQIGKELGVSTVLEGSVRKSGNRLRVTAQLINAGSEAHIWAKSYDRELDDIFVVQSDIAKQVADALQLELRTSARPEGEGRPAIRTDSYLAYLKGRTFRLWGTIEGMRKAKEQFQLAISLDPQNAAAYAGLADMTLNLGQTAILSLPRVEWDEESRQLVKKALELNPDLPEARRSLAISLCTDYEVAAAQREFQWALSLNPSDPLTQRLYAGLLFEQGHLEEGLAHLRLAEGADPKGLGVLNDLVNYLTWSGQRDEAAVCLEQLRELAPESEQYRGAWCWFAVEGPDMVEAATATQAWVDIQPESRWKEGAQAWYWTMFGEEEKARAFLQLEESRPELPQLAWAIALLYGQLGELDSCFRWLSKAVDHHIVAVALFRYSSRTRAVREDPRFQGILRRMHLA